MRNAPKKKAPEEIDEELVAASIPDTDGPIWVTPELATYWLTRNTKNRPIREARVLTFCRDMITDNWHYTGEAVKFSIDGRLIDGQHRLKAIILANVTVKMLVVVGLEGEAQAFMDAGAKRTTADALHFRDEANPTVLGSSVRFAILVETRRGNTRETVSTAEIIAWLQNHPEVRRFAAKAARYASRVDMKPSVLGYGLYRMWQVDPDDTEEFCQLLVEMRSEGPGDPIYTLLARLRNAKRNREALTPQTELAFLARAWNAWRAGAELRSLRIPFNENENPEFK